MSERKSEQEKVLSMTARRDRVEQEDITFDRLYELPKPPEELDIHGVNLWKILGGQLVAAKRLQVVDLFALEQLCYRWQKHKQMEIGKLPITPSDDNCLTAMLVQFGANPTARRKLATAVNADINAQDKEKENPFARNSKRRA